MILIHEELKLYTIDIKYVRNLHKKDNNVLSVSPQQNKASRPFVGIVVICDNKQYCIPLSSPKEKHTKMKNSIDFSKIYDSDGKLIGVLNFNEMIPVSSAQISPLDITIHGKDSIQIKKYKEQCQKELEWCNQNNETICNKASVLYQSYISGANISCRKRCLNFPLLETVCEKYNDKLKKRK